VEAERTSIAKKRLGKEVSATTDMQATWKRRYTISLNLNVTALSNSYNFNPIIP
jgi:hypothetical protein